MVKPRKLLLLDGAGALLSAIMLGGVLVYFQQYIGMPKSILFALGAAAVCFSSFSLSSYYMKSVNPKRSLKTIGLVNIIYCIVSLAIVIIYYEQLTLLGLGYFIIEKTIVLPLAFIEIRTAKKIMEIR